MNTESDSDNNNWYHVEYLAQDLVQLPVENNQYNLLYKYICISIYVYGYMYMLVHVVYAY